MPGLCSRQAKFAPCRGVCRRVCQGRPARARAWLGRPWHRGGAAAPSNAAALSWLCLGNSEGIHPLHYPHTASFVCEMTFTNAFLSK